ATPGIYTLSLHDALPISGSHCSPAADRHRPRRAVFPAGSRIVSAVIAEHAACQLAYVSADLTALQGLLDRRDAVQIDLRHGAQGIVHLLQWQGFLASDCRLGRRACSRLASGGQLAGRNGGGLEVPADFHDFVPTRWLLLISDRSGGLFKSFFRVSDRRPVLSRYVPASFLSPHP